MKINLHTHSKESDGKLSPTMLIDKLVLDNIKIFALTDHDTIKGIQEAKKQADFHKISFINGIEVSTKINGLGIEFFDESKYTIHLLGLNFDYSTLQSILNEKEKVKMDNINNLINKLIDSGYKIDKKEYGSRKTLVANELVKKGYASNKQEAFNKIINNFYPRDNDLMTVDEVVRIIHDSKGKVIWAHPYEILQNFNKLTITDEQVDKICNKLKLHNVDGIEVYYGKYSKNQIKFLEKLKDKYGFISSAGTDFHGKYDGELTFLDIDIKLIEEVLS